MDRGSAAKRSDWLAAKRAPSYEAASVLPVPPHAATALAVAAHRAGRVTGPAATARAPAESEIN